MARPTMYNEPKAQLNISINQNLLKRCRDELPEGTMSTVCERALAESLDFPLEEVKSRHELELKFKNVPQELKKSIKKFCGKESERCVIWANIVNKKCGTKLTEQDIRDFII